MQVFHDKEERLLLRQHEQPGQQRFQGFLLLPLGCQAWGWRRTPAAARRATAKQGGTSASGSG